MGSKVNSELWDSCNHLEGIPNFSGKDLGLEVAISVHPGHDARGT